MLHDEVDDTQVARQPDDFVIERSGPWAGLCDGCRARGACRLGITGSEDVGDVVRTFVACAAEHRGGPVAAHGGWIASVLDDALGAVVLREHGRVLTRSLDVRYLAPVPLEREMVVEAHVVSRDHQDWVVEGRLSLVGGARPLARATAEFVVRPDGYYARMQSGQA